MQRCSTGTATRLELPHQGVFSVGERGHRLTERRPPFLGEEQALAVKDANPREFARSRLDRSSDCRLFKASEGVGTILALLGVAFRSLTSLVKRMRRLWAGFYEVPPIFLFALLPNGGPTGASHGGCWLQRTNLWRERTNPRTGSDLLKGYRRGMCLPGSPTAD